MPRCFNTYSFFSCFTSSSVGLLRARGRILIFTSPTPSLRVAENAYNDIHGRGDPFCESIIVILGLAECRDLLSKDGEDGLGGIARLNPGKERI